MSEQNFNYAEVVLSVEGATEDDIEKIVTTISLQLNDKYREIGGNGVRPTDIERDLVQGIEILGSSKLSQVILRVTARKDEDTPLLMSALQEYINSDEFIKWIQEEMKIE